MIEKLNNNEILVAKNIHAVFQSSYKVEAKLLNAKNFPPLQRTVENFTKSKSVFLGYYKQQTLAGVIELIEYKNYIHIRSLVIAPTYFRQGIASKLIQHALSNYTTRLFVVETGLKNNPAIKLYEKFGFVAVYEWDTDHGVRKVKFEKNIKLLSN